jgi:hypothetical protein
MASLLERRTAKAATQNFLQAQKAKVKKFEKKANHQLTKDGHEMDKQNEHAVQKSKTATDDHLAKQSEGVQGIEVEVRRKQAQEEGSLRNQMCKAPFERTGVANCKVYKQTAKLTEKLGEIALIRQQIANIKLDEQELGDGAKQDLDQQMKEARKKLAKQRKKLNTIIDDGQKLYDSMPHPHPRKNFADIARSKVHKHSEKTNKEAAERLEVYELHVTLLKAKEGKGGPEDLTGSSQKLKSELGTDSKGKVLRVPFVAAPEEKELEDVDDQGEKNEDDEDDDNNDDNDGDDHDDDIEDHEGDVADKPD